MSKAAATGSAFAVAAIVPAAYLAGLTVIQTGRFSDLGVILLILGVSVVLTATLVLPTFLLLDRFRLASAPIILLAGVLVGVVVGAVVLYPTELDANGLVIFAPAGLAAGIAFWVVRRAFIGRSVVETSRDQAP
jgi:hypothetical protein